MVCIYFCSEQTYLLYIALFVRSPRVSDVDGKTQTSVRMLDYDGRVKELSRILGGINVTDAQRAAAIDMLNEREN